MRESGGANPPSGFIMNTIATGGVGQKQLEDAPRGNVDRLARWLNQLGANIPIDSMMDQVSLASIIYWSREFSNA